MFSVGENEHVFKQNKKDTDVFGLIFILGLSIILHQFWLVSGFFCRVFPKMNSFIWC